MTRARSYAISEHHAGRAKVSGAEVLDAMRAVLPDIWQAWRAWAGPGSERIDFETFRPCHFAVLEGFMTVLMTEHGEPFAASQLAAHIREKYTGHYAAWERDDSTCIVRALRRHADTGLIGFDGLHVGIGPAMTRDYVRAYSEAYRAEGERQMAEAEALERVSDALAATGCSTLREYRERFGHEPQ